MSEQSAIQPKTILIVEDEPAIADNIAFAVETENMVPLHASTAGAARTLLEQNPTKWRTVVKAAQKSAGIVEQMNN